ncbi:uncharacterized protein LOC100843697 isoform X2 [Brachypodium distachyon]|uniref:Uncharacterized protein n=1 Tax=Brachypodium distachyon TaxID=15368 RepID=A0A2K2CQX7_BRADI|nr:uncharacterized protein LOC100843697 isoform X2 [Brachypodium distachyon]PNT64432.1 hypothetical protein BRADI_4g28460v3 [Brachypodium distachyon]|eukprot:XP_024319121.1 uncharacterized protein LOC100843697 isoform X2 [Brachypodium distachyon]
MVGLELRVPHEANRSWPPRCGRLPAAAEDGDSAEGAAGGLVEGSEEEAAGNAGVPPVSCSGGLPHTPPQPQPETLVEEREEGGDGDVCSSDGQFVRDCVDRRGRTGDGELEKMEENGGREKRWLTSAVNPPPKRRMVSAIRRFPRGSPRYAVVDTSIGCWRNAVTNTSTGGEEGYVFEATPISFASGGVSAEDASHMVTTSSILRRDVSNDEMQGKREEVGGATEAHNHKIQESSVGKSFVLDDFAQDQDDNDHPQNDVTKGSPRHGFAEKIDETRTLHERKPISLIAADGDVRSKWNGRLRKGIPSTYVTDPVNVKTKGKRLRNPKMNVALLDDAGVVEECTVRNDTSSTPRGVTHSNINVKQHMVTRKLKRDGIGKEPLNTSRKESKCVNHVVTGQIEENNDAGLSNVKIIVQALMAPDKCPWRQGKKSLAGVSRSLARGDDVKIKNAAPRNELPSKVTPSTLTRHETREDRYSSFEDNENSTAVVAHEKNNKLCVTLPSCVAFVDESVDAQSKVTKMDESTPSHERKHVPRLAGDGDARSKCEGSLLEGTSEFHVRDLVDVRTKGKKLESVNMNVTLLDDFEDDMMRYKTPSTQRGVTCSTINVKQRVVAHDLKFDGIDKDPLNRFAKESKSGNHLAVHQTEKNDDVGLVTKKIIVLALMAPDKCPWTQGKKSIAGARQHATIG